jgi:hypothetical protein
MQVRDYILLCKKNIVFMLTVNDNNFTRTISFMYGGERGGAERKGGGKWEKGMGGKERG